MITVQIHAAEYDVQEIKARKPPEEGGGPLAIRVLMLRDPNTGIPIHYPFPVDEAEKLGRLLQGEKAPDLVVASPADVPVQPPEDGHAPQHRDAG